MLAIETEGWERWIKAEHLDPTVRPVAIRNLRCKREAVFRHTFVCDYLVDYGKDSAVSGTLERTYWTFAREKDGRLAEVIIVA